MSQIPVALLNGLVAGASLALVAAGLALLFGVLDIINFAQGDLFMLGGYGLILSLRLTHSFWLSVALATIVVGVVGGLTLLLLVWPLLDKPHALVLLATLGLSLIVEQLATNVFGGDVKVVRPPITAQIPIGGVSYPVYDLVILGVGIAVLAAGYFLLRYARYGIWLRAVAQNRPMAAVLGVPVPRVYVLAFIVSSALAAISGSLLVPVTSVYPTVGQDVILKAFIVVVAGGLGNFRGAAIVAFLIGGSEALGSVWIRPTLVEIIVFAMVIAILIARSRRESAAVRL
jgi:branched-subunit amino acid ABC-type transport system permease component